MRSSLAITAVGVLIAVACRDPAINPPQGSGPEVRALSALALVEPDSLFLTRPSTMLRGPRGELYVSDIVANRVIQYDGAGHPIQVFGRPGGGPGEFRQASPMFLRDGSTLAVLDLSRAVYQLFSVQTSAFLGSIGFEGIGWSVAYQDSVIWLGAMNLRRGTVVAGLRTGRDTFEYQIPIPQEYVTSPILAGTYAGAHVVVWADSFIVGMPGSDVLRVFTTQGRFVDSLIVPVRVRRGVPADLQQMLRPRRGRTLRDWVRAASTLLGLFRQGDGRIVLVHADYDVEGPLTTADLFVSSLSADRRAACVDRHLPVSKDAAPVLAFRDDTLYVLDRQLVTDSTVETTVRAYAVSESGCEAVPLP